MTPNYSFHISNDDTIQQETTLKQEAEEDLVNMERERRAFCPNLPRTTRPQQRINIKRQRLFDVIPYERKDLHRTVESARNNL